MTDQSVPNTGQRIRRLLQWIILVLAVGGLTYGLAASLGVLETEAVIRRSTLLLLGSLASQSLSGILARRRSAWLMEVFLALGIVLLVWTIVEAARGH